VSRAEAGPAISEIVLNSSAVQIIHNSIPDTDVLNMSLDVTNHGDAGSCDGDAGSDNLLTGGISFFVSSGLCPGSGTLILATYNYVVHRIGGVPAYGTIFLSSGPATLASKIVPLATPLGACGRWKINLQITGLDLSAFVSTPIGLGLDDGDNDSLVCSNVNANIGEGIVKPHHGVHHARR
jgi:hypothetical protein